MLENKKVMDIISSLCEVEGLANIQLLKEEDKDIIRNLEDEHNVGVLTCLDRNFTIVLTHDSRFRPPVGEVVAKENGKIVLPPLPFPEVIAKNVVSGSPNEETHKYLVKNLGIELNDEATLLIGFDL